MMRRWWKFPVYNDVVLAIQYSDAAFMIRFRTKTKQSEREREGRERGEWDWMEESD